MTFQGHTAEFNAATTAKSGLAKGTIVLTLRGEVAVEDLRVGDKIITRDVGAQPLRALKRQSGDSKIVAKDSLGKNRPAQDLRVATEQPFLMRNDVMPHNSVLLTTARLMAEETHSRLENTRLYRLVFDRSHVIYANGAELAVA